MNVLVIDIGGSHIKVLVSGKKKRRKCDSGDHVTPQHLLKCLPGLTKGWKYDVISLGYPGRVGPRGPEAEPGNLGHGWVGFDFEKELGRPVRILNDAAMQALGAYDGGRMLFIGLGTGVGSALVSERVVIPLELGDLLWKDDKTLFNHLGKAGRKQLGQKKWCQQVVEAVEVLRLAFHADYVVIGGGNAKHVEPLPPHTRRGGNEDAMTGGFRMWEETVVPHDKPPSNNWRVLR